MSLPDRNACPAHTMAKKLIIGLGTGRCGTLSLSLFLNAQPGITMLHEGKQEGARARPLRWQGDRDELWRWLETLERASGDSAYYGDIGMYFLPYAEALIQRFPDIKLVCLKRNRQEVVNSYLEWTQGRNHWFEHDGVAWDKNPAWDGAFPKFNEPDKAKAIGLYWDMYYADVDRLIRQYPGHIACFWMDSLNRKRGRRAILDFIGYGGPRVVDGHHRANQRPSIAAAAKAAQAARAARMARAAKALQARCRAAAMSLQRWAARAPLWVADKTLDTCRVILPKKLRHYLWMAFAKDVHEFLRNGPKKKQ